MATTFEEFAQNYPDQWLPYYHASSILITNSFAETDGGKSLALLDRAKKSLDVINRAKSLNPDNHRAWLLDGMMTSNLPEFIGGGPAAAKAIFLEAEIKFEEFQNEDPLWPKWVEDQVQDELSKLKDVQIPVEE